MSPTKRYRRRKDLGIHRTDWGNIVGHGDGLLVQPTFSHVHECQAGGEGRECLFLWDRHQLDNTRGECDCMPELDLSNVDNPAAECVVFIVHKGSC